MSGSAKFLEGVDLHYAVIGVGSRGWDGNDQATLLLLELSFLASPKHGDLGDATLQSGYLQFGFRWPVEHVQVNSLALRGRLPKWEVLPRTVSRPVDGIAVNFHPLSHRLEPLNELR